MPGPDPVAGGRRFGQPKCGGPMLLRHTVRLPVVVSLSAVTGQLGRTTRRPGAAGGPPTASRLEVSTVLRLSLPSARVLLCHSPGRRWAGPPTVSRREVLTGLRSRLRHCHSVPPATRRTGPPSVSRHELSRVKRGCVVAPSAAGRRRVTVSGPSSQQGRWWLDSW